jgi:hypothetical protein
LLKIPPAYHASAVAVFFLKELEGPKPLQGFIKSKKSYRQKETAKKQ